jgi:hypothetical protein
MITACSKNHRGKFGVLKIYLWLMFTSPAAQMYLETLTIGFDMCFSSGVRPRFRVVVLTPEVGRSNSNNYKESTKDHKTSADSAQLHLQERRVGPSSYGDLPLTSRILDRGSGSQSERPIADWPLPPGYSGMYADNFHQMDEMRPAVPHITGSVATQGQAPVRRALCLSLLQTKKKPEETILYCSFRFSSYPRWCSCYSLRH